MIEAVQQSATPILLFIDEAHTLIGAGNSAGSGDAANLLKPALARGELRTIAATTWSEHKQYFERDAALERRFQMVKVDEPDDDNACLMLRGLKERYARHHNVHITDAAVSAAACVVAPLSDGASIARQGRRPARCGGGTRAHERRCNANRHRRASRGTGRATCRARCAGRRSGRDTSVDMSARLAAIDARLLAVAAEIDNLEQNYAEQKKAVSALTDLRAQWRAASDESARRDLQPEIKAAHALADEAWRRSADSRGSRRSRDRKRHRGLDRRAGRQPARRRTHHAAGTGDAARANGRRRGRRTRRARQIAAGRQSRLEVRRRAARRVPARRSVRRQQDRSGAGTHDLMFGGERALVTINLSEYQEAHTVSQLKGSPPGYVGYGRGGVLTEAVRQRPYSVVLLDEVEKAHRDVLNLFYQVFDRGFMRDGEGRVIDFRNTVIVMTSNLGSDEIMAAVEAAQLGVAKCRETAAARIGRPDRHRRKRPTHQQAQPSPPPC